MRLLPHPGFADSSPNFKWRYGMTYYIILCLHNNYGVAVQTSASLLWLIGSLLRSELLHFVDDKLPVIG